MLWHRNEDKDIQAAKKGFERSKCQVVSYCSLIIPNIILKNGDKTNPSQNRLPRFYLGWLYKLYNLSFWQICGKSYVSTYIWLYKLYNLYKSAKKKQENSPSGCVCKPTRPGREPLLKCRRAFVSPMRLGCWRTCCFLQWVEDYELSHSTLW